MRSEKSTHIIDDSSKNQKQKKKPNKNYISEIYNLNNTRTNGLNVETVEARKILTCEHPSPDFEN